MSEQVQPQADQNQKVVLTLGALQEMLNYFSQRPYAEVFKIIDTLKTAQTFESVVQQAMQTANPVQETTPVQEGA